jgi:primosomal protein N' (replication factor Y)
VGEHRPGRRPQVGPGSLSSEIARITDSEASGEHAAPPSGRIVRVLPDEPGIDKEFTYLVPPARAADDPVEVGTIVRFDLHGRRLRGWVTAVDVETPRGVEVQPITKVTGHGPSAELIDLAGWAAWRWAGRRAHLLRTASPPTAVTSLPGARSSDVPVPAVHDSVARGAFGGGLTVLRWPPAADRYPLVLAAAALGNALVLVPSHEGARQLAVRLRRAGVAVALMDRDWAVAAAGSTVIGARAAAWAPVRDLAAVLVLDEHDETWKEERAPAWNARDVAVERARRAGVPCVLVSPMPSLEAQREGRLVAPSRRDERAGWPVVDVVDRRDDGSGGGLYSSRLVQAARRARRAVCVLNRKGRSRLLACARCNAITMCEHCGAAMGQDETVGLVCRVCHRDRPVVCQECGATKLKNLRIGINRAREELEALLRTPVVEVSGATAGGALPEAGVYVGTEAVLHQVRDADLVAFLDFDQELLAPRYRAGEEALALLVRAARLVGGREGGGRILVQTRLPRHEVVAAALHADPARVSSADAARRSELGFPPAVAMAEISGQAAAAFIESLGAPMGLDLLGPRDGRWLVRAPDHETLCDALAATPRPSGRLRIEVDPLRV